MDLEEAEEIVEYLEESELELEVVRLRSRLWNLVAGERGEDGEDGKETEFA